MLCIVRTIRNTNTICGQNAEFWWYICITCFNMLKLCILSRVCTSVTWGFKSLMLEFTVAWLIWPMTFFVEVINASFMPNHLPFFRFVFITQISSWIISMKYTSIQNVLAGSLPAFAHTTYRGDQDIPYRLCRLKLASRALFADLFMLVFSLDYFSTLRWRLHFLPKRLLTVNHNGLISQKVEFVIDGECLRLCWGGNTWT
jgi:hypothetical protein